MRAEYDTFEQTMTCGKAQWLTRVDQDNSTCHLVLALTGHPDTGVPQQSLTFTEVQSVTSDWFSRDDRCMEGVLGFHKRCVDGKFEYLLHSEQREIRLSCKRQVQLDVFANIAGAGFYVQRAQ
jgi:hypothetical protein